MTMVFILAGLIVTNLICAALLFEGIVNDFGDGTIYVMFSAVEVKKAVQKILDESTVYGNDCPDGKCEM